MFSIANFVQISRDLLRAKIATIRVANVNGVLTALLPTGVAYPFSIAGLGQSLGIKTVTAAYTATLANDTVLGNAAGGGFTITLPTAASAYNSTTGIGKVFTFVNIGASNTVTIDGAGSETINGATTKALATQYSLVSIQSTGTAWFLVGEYTP